MSLMMKIFDIMFTEKKSVFLGGGAPKKLIHKGNCLKGGGLGQFPDLKGQKGV